MSDKSILVIGGGGFYGRYVVDDLVRSTEAEILVAGRNPPTDWARADRIRSVACDLNDLAALERLAGECSVVVHCAGPFQSLPLNPLHAAIRTGTHYVDISEDRAFRKAVLALEPAIRDAGISVASGFSVAPAMEALFAEMVRGRSGASWARLTSIRTFAAPDTRKHRGKAMFHTMLSGVGQRFRQPRQGMLAEVNGWTEAEWVEFPPPIGERLTYLVLEMADLDLLPELFGVETVEFKAGTEWPILNRLLGMAAKLRATTGYPDWTRFQGAVRAFSWLVGRLGKDEGGVIFEIGGIAQGMPATRRIALTARRDGGLIPAVLAAIAAARLHTRRLTLRGILPVHRWIDADDLIEELRSRKLQLWQQAPDQEEWTPFDSYQSLR